MIAEKRKLFFSFFSYYCYLYTIYVNLTLSSCAAVQNVFGSSIPIEVMFAGSNDLDIEKQNAMKSLHKNVSVVDILHVFDESIVGLQGGGWAIKPFAIMASSFEQVIMADADCVFLQSPEAAFDDPGYIASGTLFFHDRVFDFPNATPKTLIGFSGGTVL